MKIEDLELERRVRFRHGHTEYTGTIEAVSVRTTPFNVEVFIDIGFYRKNGEFAWTQRHMGELDGELSISGVIVKDDEACYSFEFVDEEADK